MKTKQSASKAAFAAIKRARLLADEIELQTGMMVENHKDKEYFKHCMPRLRAELAELNQRIHEFNAYSNCVLTE